MARNVRVAAIVAVTTASLVAALTIPAQAASPQPQAQIDGTVAGSGVSPEVFSALARDLKLDPAGVQARLATEAKASKADLSLRKNLGGTYAGMWISPDAKSFTIAVTDEARVAQVRATGAQVKVVTRSLAQLDAAKARLDATSTPKEIPGTYIDVAGNSVVILAHTSVVGDTFVKASGADPAAVRVEVSQEAPRTFIDIVGGNAYFISGLGRCSIGFSVVGGFVTAGHCGNTGASTSQPSGVVAGSSFPGNDYGWVRADPGNTPLGLVNNYAGGTVAVAGSADAAIGASVCRSGSTTGWRCGTIQARNATVNYPQGTVTGLIRTSVCAEPGDSGGSLIAGDQAQGVTSGGSGNCSSGGTTFFQPVNEILQAYGLNLITSDPPPSPIGTIALRAVVNGLFVCAESAGAAPLIANRGGIGLWESFDVIDTGDGYVALRAQVNGRYVAAENGGGAPLIANRDAIGLWEKFQIIDNGDGTVSLRAAVNSRYVAAESAGGAPLIANRDAIGPWEQFELINL